MFWDGVGSCISLVCGVAMFILLGFLTDSFDDDVSMKGYFCLQFLMCFGLCWCSEVIVQRYERIENIISFQQ